MPLRVAFAVLVVAFLAGCGGGPPSPESVVRAWSNALNAGDNDEAAKLFALRAEVIQPGRTITLDTTAEARAFNAALPCSGEIVEIESEGVTVRATFALGDRETSRCDGPGARVRAVFRVQDGKIVLWHQLPSAVPPAGDAV